MSRFLFVGEKPSPRAYAAGLTWRDGMLAAKTLFDALNAHGVDPATQEYYNLFGDTPECQEKDCPETRKRARRIRRMAAGRTVVAMGCKVSTLLGFYGVDHLRMVHPAARGAIREKDVYIRHVCDTLGLAAA